MQIRNTKHGQFQSKNLSQTKRKNCVNPDDKMLKDWKILYEWWATCESPSNHDLTSAASQEWWEGDSKICNASRVRSEATSRVINCRFVRSRIMSTGFSNPSTFCRQDYHSCCFKSDLFSKGVFWWLKLLRYTKST